MDTKHTHLVYKWISGYKDVDGKEIPLTEAEAKELDAIAEAHELQRRPSGE